MLRSFIVQQVLILVKTLPEFQAISIRQTPQKPKMRISIQIRILMLLALLVLNSSLAQANAVAIIDGVTGVYLPLVDSRINVSVDNQIATVKTQQTFKNNTESYTGFKYGFPLNQTSNPISLRWKINGTWHEASISADEQDNEILGGTGQDPGNPEQALIDYLGSYPMYFTVQDSIAADSSIVMELTYVELLPYSFGEVQFDFKNDYSGIQSAP